MAIGDSIQAGLLKADFSPIERSGQSIGQGYKSLGQNLFMGSGGGTGGGTRSSRSGGSSPSGIGGAIERFSENKKKGEQAEAELLGLIETMSPSRLEDLDSGKSRFSKAYKRFIDGELTPNQTEALFGGLVLSEKRNNEVEEKQKLVDFSNFIMSGTEMDPEVVEDFNQAQPGLSALSGDPGARNQFLEYQRDNAPKTGPLGGELGSSDFARFAKEQGIDPVLAGSRFMNLQKAEAEAELADQPKPLSPSEKLAREEFEYKKSQDSNKPIPLTDGEKSRDRKFGDQLVEFNLPDINKGLEQLTEASEALSKSNTLTGPIVSLMPNFVGDRVNPKAAEVREAVEEVVQRNLRLVLGAQFTEKEGERLISRAYNPTLDEAENKKRVERLIKSIKDAAQEKLNMKSYFEKNGTLKGYDSNQPSIASIEQSAFGESAPADQSTLDEIERKKQLRSKRAGL